MAAVKSSPGGFSYAQAAKNARPPVAVSQPLSNKVTSGTATPAKSSLSEVAPSGTWADDVEASVSEKARETSKDTQERSKSVSVKENAINRPKSEVKAQNGTSGVSSPDLTASTSPTTKDDDSSSAPTGSSETTWETKSTTSEPPWIAERKERQGSSQNSESTVKDDMKPKEAPLPSPPKPAVLQEAPPPPINPWIKRSEEAKAKLAAQQQAPRPVSNAIPTDAQNLKENQRPRADSRKKANSIAGVPRADESQWSGNTDFRKPGSSQGKRASDVRADNVRQGSTKPVGEDPVSTTGTRAASNGRSSPPDLPAVPPPVKDETSWPTPDRLQEKERKEVVEADRPEIQTEDATPAQKPRKKLEWQPMPVTPNIIFETTGIKERGAPRSSIERNGRGGARGRGGQRGSANGGNGSERRNTRPNTSQSNQDESQTMPRGRSNTADREAMPPPPRPNRASSAGSWREQYSESRPERNTRLQSLTETRPHNKSAKHVPTSSRDADMVGGFTKPFEETCRTKSPQQLESSVPEAKDEVDIPDPIPRALAVDTQADEKAGQADTAVREHPPIRMVPSESRKEQRNSDSFRDQNWNTAPRGNKRGGRGRGGTREFPNGHTSSPIFTNGYAPDFTAATPYSVPPSPSLFPSPRGNHQFGYPSPARGAWPRSHPRAQSIQIDGYGPFATPYTGPLARPPPPPTYVPGMYEYNYPMTAVPYTSAMNPETLTAMVTTQLDYYFSLENLVKDVFLRKHMDSQGFVFLDVIAPFNRVQRLTQDRDILTAACINSKVIEIRVGEDGKERLRSREDWKRWVKPMAERDPSAQNEGPQQLHVPEMPQLQIFGHLDFRGSAPAGVPTMEQRLDRRSYDASYPMMNGSSPQRARFPTAPEAAYADWMNGEDARGRAAKSPIRDYSISPTQQLVADVAEEKDMEPDMFLNEQVSVLTVVVRVKDPRATHPNAVSRTFSNGSIDSRSIFGEIQRSSDGQEAPKTNGEETANGVAASPSLSRQVSPHGVRSAEHTSNESEITFLWSKKDNDEGSSEPLPEGSTQEPYTALRNKALDQRRHAATGTCPYDLIVLYQFWSHFLVRNFNSRMYNEFKYYAHDDAKERLNIQGLQNLVLFYDKSLLSQTHQPIRERVVKDYVELVKNEPTALDGAAFKQLRAAWRNGAMNLKNRKKLTDIVDEELKQRLETLSSAA